MDFSFDDNDMIKILETNKAYLARITTILYAKNKCVPVFFWDDNGKELEQKIIQIVDLAECSVSITEGKGITKACLDGTDFKFSFMINDEDGKYTYRNKVLGIDYSYSERELPGEILERVIIKRVGNTTIRVKYYVSEDFIIISEFLQENKQTKKVIAMLNSDLASFKNDNEISSYIMEIISESLEEIYDENSNAFQEEEYPEVETCDERISYREDIESEVGEVYYNSRLADYCIKMYDFPCKVQDFDYKDYLEFERNLEGGKVEVNIDENSEKVTQSEEIDDGEFGYYDEDSYRVFYDEEITDKELKESVIANIYTAVSCENQEIMDLVDTIKEIQDEYDKSIEMIREYYSRINKDKEDSKDVGFLDK